ARFIAGEERRRRATSVGLDHLAADPGRRGTVVGGVLRQTLHRMDRWDRRVARGRYRLDEGPHGCEPRASARRRSECIRFPELVSRSIFRFWIHANHVSYA